MSGTAFRVLLRMQIRPGLERDFERVWLDIGCTIAGQPGVLGQTLLETIEDGTYLTVSDWTDEPAFRRFEHSAEHVGNRRRLEPFRVGGSMTTMQVVHRVAGPAIGER